MLFRSFDFAKRVLVTGYRHIIGIRVLVHETLLQNHSRAVAPAVPLLLAREAGRQGTLLADT
jgi:hypothetical protein